MLSRLELRWVSLLTGSGTLLALGRSCMILICVLFIDGITQACFLPEASDFIVPTTSACYNLSQPLVSHTYTLALQALAKDLGVWIVVGIHELPGEDDDDKVKEESKKGLKVFNTYVAIGPEGKVEASYRKVSGFHPLSLVTTSADLVVITLADPLVRRRPQGLHPISTGSNNSCSHKYQYRFFSPACQERRIGPHVGRLDHRPSRSHRDTGNRTCRSRNLL